MNGPSDPGIAGIVYTALPLLALMAILAVRGLGQTRPMAVAIVRLLVQLSALTVVLRWVFAHQSPGLVTAIGVGMLLASAHTVGARRKTGGRAWITAEAFAAMGLSTLTVLAVALFAALRVRPWYSAQTVIPLLGMILGNSVSGVSLAVERFESELLADRDRIERRLALGATSRQAALPALRAAVAAALTPTINSMAIAGIVAIPGMSTGQILAGADVGVALRYQIMIYFAISATCGLGTLLLLAARLRRWFTPAHQLRRESS